MLEKEIAYIAGLIDGEGTFNCQLRIKDTLRINPRIQIGFKQSKEENDLLRFIQSKLGGKIYISNDGKEDGQIRWMTTRFDEVIPICEMIHPFLRLKKAQCEKLLTITKIMKKNHRAYHVNYRKTYKKEELQIIVTLATTMNAGRQNTKYRDTIGGNTEYYLSFIDRMYDAPT